MIHFVVHSHNDSSGVAVVEGIEAGQTLTGWVMDDDRLISVAVSDAIPIGHKLALVDIPEGGTVIKYREAGTNKPAIWRRPQTRKFPTNCWPSYKRCVCLIVTAGKTLPTVLP